MMQTVTDLSSMTHHQTCLWAFVYAVLSSLVSLNCFIKCWIHSDKTEYTLCLTDDLIDGFYLSNIQQLVNEQDSQPD